MVDLEFGMGGQASAKGGGTPEIWRKWDWSEAERRGGGRDAVFNNGVDPHLRIMERLGDIQRQELDKGMIIANNLKGKLNIPHTTNESWIVTTIKAILKTPIQKFEKSIFLFRRTHAAVVRNSKILAAFKGDLIADIAAQKDTPVNYGSEFCGKASLEKWFLYHEDKTKIINIIQKGSRYHLNPIQEETQK